MHKAKQYLHFRVIELTKKLHKTVWTVCELSPNYDSPKSSLPIDIHNFQ